MRIDPKIKIVAAVLVCVVLDIVLHVVTSSYATIPHDSNFSFLAKILGKEITATLWAIFAFSVVAFVYWHIRNEIPGKGVEKGLRYGAAIALLWIFGMLEGVPLFGNPLINEFIVGLSDAIPVFILGVLLSKVKTSKVESDTSPAFTLRQKITAISIFSGIFLLGRYIAYLLGIIHSGIQTKGSPTLIWTILMGLIIGVAFILLSNGKGKLSLKLRCIKFGGLIFGVNWAVFLIFMPLLFSGYITDAFLRIIIDITLVMIAAYLTTILNERNKESNWHEFENKTEIPFSQ